MSYDLWMKAVNLEIRRRTGMTADDLDDWRYRADYEEKRTPKQTAARAIRNAKESMGM